MVQNMGKQTVETIKLTRHEERRQPPIFTLNAPQGRKLLYLLIFNRCVRGSRWREFGVVTPLMDSIDPIADAQQDTNKLKDPADNVAIRKVGYNKNEESDPQRDGRHDGRAHIIMSGADKIKHRRYDREHGCSATAIPAIKLVEVFTHERTVG